MGKMFKILGKTVLTACKEAADSVYDSISKVEVEDVKEFVVDKAKKTKEFFNESLDKLNEIKEDTFKKQEVYNIQIPFNKCQETITCNIEGNMFNIEVKARDESKVSKTTLEIPNDVDTSSVIQLYDAENKMLNITFNKF